MILKIIICVITGIAISQFINIVTPAMSNSDYILQAKIESSPQYNDGRFNDMGNALNMSFTDYFLVVIRVTSVALNRSATSMVHLT